MAEAKLIKLVEEFSGKKILVLGDVMVDQYTFGSVNRISPEAPVPVFRKKSEKFTIGGAANVAANVAALGGSAILCGIVGNDSRKDILFTRAKNLNIDTSPIIVSGTRPTTLKHRIVAGANHQLMRIDDEVTDSVDEETENVILEKILPLISTVDVVVLSDYTKGFFTKRVVSEIITAAKSSGVPVCADIKPKNASIFIGVDLITPNTKEAEELTGKTDVGEMGRDLMMRFQSEVLVTRGEDGMSAFDKEGSQIDLPSKKISVFDVSGAGDTVVAVMALAKAAKADLSSAAFTANVAGSVVVQKPGTATLTQNELKSALGATSHFEDAYTVKKVWGHEKWIENNDRYCSKLLFLNKGYECSLHFHKDKDETFLIKSGHVRLVLGDDTHYMYEGNFIRIPPGVPHSFRGIEDSVILEVSSHHDEADSYRLSESRKVEEEIPL